MRPPSPADATPGTRVLIVGAGFSGLCLGIRLRSAGIHSFALLEKAEDLGGTWRENTYPGAACDVPSMSYCFSFEQKTDWSRKWAPQAEILEYMEHCAEKYGILPHIRFGTEVESARFDAEGGLWRVRTAGGEELTASFLVSAVGQLHRPHIPDLPGLDRYRGTCFHSARWDHGFDFSGRDVAVVGNAASAIQFIPRIAPAARRVFVFQRSANWMFPRRDRAYTEAEKRRYTRHPWLARLARWRIWATFESQWPVFARRGGRVARLWERLARRYLKKTIPDPELRAALTPDYPIGAKRILISDDYYETLLRDDVEVITDPIDHFDESAVVCRGGRRIPVDAVILATGFRSTEFLAPMRIEGLAGRSLEREWKDGAAAYLGLTVPGFPNFFMMYGPNTNLGHNSILFMIECQARYILRCIEEVSRRGARTLDLRQEAMDAFNRRLQADLARTAWAAPARSWYKTPDGRITNNWSGSTLAYWWRTRRPDFSAYRIEPR